MADVRHIAAHHNRVEAPAELRALQGWLVWRSEQHEGEPKPRKVPYYADGGRRVGKQGSTADRDRLTTFAAAKAAAAKGNYSGVGLALMPEFGITALDFDNCFDAEGNLPDEIADIVNYTYSEFSPSGKGVRAFVKGNYGNRKSPPGDGQCGFETFHSSGFVTFTGLILPVPDIAGFHDTVSNSRADKVAALCAERFNAQKTLDNDDFMAGNEHTLGLTVGEMDVLLGPLDPDMSREDWIKVGMALHHETEGDDTGFALWDEWSARGGKYPGTEALQDQWDSFTRRMGQGRHNVTMATVKWMNKEALREHERGADGMDVDELRDVSAEAAKTAHSGSGGMQTPSDFDGRYKIITAASSTRDAPPEWFIKGVLPKGDPIFLYGPSGSGKTFIALDMALAIARGVEWRGHRTNKARVLIIAAEGGGGIGGRIKAYCQQHDLKPEDLDIGIIKAAPNFLNKEDMTEVVKAVAAAGGADLIVGDTFAQMTAGANENAGEDMGRALANVRILSEITGATVKLVHHAGKDLQRGLRGWSGLRAAANAELEVSRHDDGARDVKITKMKDGQDGAQWGFKLDVVQVGVDSDGDPVTSCVVVPSDVSKAPIADDKRTKRRGPVQRHILEMVEILAPDRKPMSYDAFVEGVFEAMPVSKSEDKGKREAAKSNLHRTVQSFNKEKDGPIGVMHGKIVFYE